MRKESAGLAGRRSFRLTGHPSHSAHRATVHWPDCTTIDPNQTLFAKYGRTIARAQRNSPLRSYCCSRWEMLFSPLLLALRPFLGVRLFGDVGVAAGFLQRGGLLGIQRSVARPLRGNASLDKDRFHR